MANQDPGRIGNQRRSATSTMTENPGGATGSSQGGTGTVERVRVEVQEKAGQAVEQAQERTKSMLDSQKDRLAMGLSDISQVLHRTGEQMEKEDQANIARYAHTAADTVDRLSTSLRDRSMDEILDDVEGYARRQPEVVVGGAFLLGFLASRFLKASSARRSQATARREYGTEPAAWSGYYLAGGWPQGSSRQGQTAMGGPSGMSGSSGMGGSSASGSSTYATGTGMASRGGYAAQGGTSTTGTGTSSSSSQSASASTGEAFAGCDEESR